MKPPSEHTEKDIYALIKSWSFSMVSPFITDERLSEAYSDLKDKYLALKYDLLRLGEERNNYFIELMHLKYDFVFQRRRLAMFNGRPGLEEFYEDSSEECSRWIFLGYIQREHDLIRLGCKTFLETKQYEL